MPSPPPFPKSIALGLTTVLVLATGPALAAGRVVTGRVSDAATSAPIAGATVEILDQAWKTKTDAEGRFSLKGIPAGSWVLHTQKPPRGEGYDEVIVPEDADPAPIELLLVQEEAVEQVVVVPPRKEAPAAGGTEVEREQVVKLPGTRGDLLQSLQSLPGVANTGALTPFSGGVVIRGASPNDSSILVDGFEVPVLYHFGALQSVLTSEMIDRIVYRPGGFGVEYGRASGGVVQVETRPGRSDKASGFVEMSFINGAAFVQGPIGKSKNLTFSASFRRSLIDAVLPAVLPDDQGLSFTALPRYYDYQLRLDAKVKDRWKLSLFLFGTDDGTKFVSSADNASDPQATGQYRNDTRFLRLVGSATYEGDKLTNRIAISPRWVNVGFGVGTRAFETGALGVTLRDEATVRFSPRLRLFAGAELDVTRRRFRSNVPRLPREGDPAGPSFTYDPALVVDETFLRSYAAGWASLEWAVTGNLLLSFGGRYDGYLRNGSHLFQPRGDLKLLLAKGTTLRASGGLYSRPPDKLDEVLQKDLRPEQAIQTTFGIEQDLGAGFSLQSTAFYTWRSDLITYATERQDPTRVANPYVNGGTGRSFGAEFLLKSTGPRHFGWISYTLSRSLRQDAPGAPERLFDYDQTHNLVALLSRRFGSDQQWQVGARFQYTTGRPYTPVLGATFESDPNRYRPIYGAINSGRVEDFHQLDLRVDRIFRLEGWTLSAFIDVTNVYMHTSPTSYQYSYDYSERSGVKGLPILPSFGLRGEF